MRHGKKFNHLSRTSVHRKAMLANMACSLIEHKRIQTTLAKAKALRVYIEPLITKSKQDTIQPMGHSDIRIQHCQIPKTYAQRTKQANKI